MSDFQRFAIYYLPDYPVLAAFGASWLGWDVETGTSRAQPDIEGIDRFTSTPRKYGFHGTLKPPFRLAEGSTPAVLAHNLMDFARYQPPVQLEGLQLSQIGKFFALVPEGNTSELSKLAFSCVRAFDGHRRPAEPSELVRRRAAELTPRQDELLLEWGYPYVADEFRFHLTLTGKLESEDRSTVQAALGTLLPDLPRPYTIKSVALAGERSDGMFQLIHRYALTG